MTTPARGHLIGLNLELFAENDETVLLCPDPARAFAFDLLVAEARPEAKRRLVLFHDRQLHGAAVAAA